jgi:hypothetical protein
MILVHRLLWSLAPAVGCAMGMAAPATSVSAASTQPAAVAAGETTGIKGESTACFAQCDADELKCLGACKGDARCGAPCLTDAARCGRGCQPHAPTLSVAALDPPSGQLGDSDPLYIKLTYQSDQPVTFQAQGLLRGQRVWGGGFIRGLGGLAPQLEGAGETVVSIAYVSGATIDAIEISAVDSHYRTLASTQTPIKLSWTAGPPRDARTYANWVTPMKEIADRATMKQTGADPLTLLWTAMVFTAPTYLVLQLWFAYRWTGGWRRAALVPLVVVLPVLAITAGAVMRHSNVGPLSFVPTALPALLYLLIAWVLRKAERVGGADPSGRNTIQAIPIVAWAFCVGSASFDAGLFGPDFFSKSDRTASVGALLGFVTGPLGALVGALIGALSVAKRSGRLSLACIAAVWVMALLYTFLCFDQGGRLGIPAIPLQVLVIASIVFLYSRRDTPAELPEDVRRCGPIAIPALLIILFMTLFPPVIRPWWAPATHQPAATAPLPSFAFVFDKGFDTSRLPEFAVNRGVLALEWFFTAIVAVGLCLFLRAVRHRARV